jgi:hypothetical protein
MTQMTQCRSRFSHRLSTSGNTDGQLTKLDSARQKERIKGEMGEGESETSAYVHA